MNAAGPVRRRSPPGGATGAFLAVERSTGFSESWPLTFAHPDSGAVWLALYDRSDRAAGPRPVRALAAPPPDRPRQPRGLFRGVE